MRRSGSSYLSGARPLQEFLRVSRNRPSTSSNYFPSHFTKFGILWHSDRALDLHFGLLYSTQCDVIFRVTYLEQELPNPCGNLNHKNYTSAKRNLEGGVKLVSTVCAKVSFSDTSWTDFNGLSYGSPVWGIQTVEPGSRCVTMWAWVKFPSFLPVTIQIKAAYDSFLVCSDVYLMRDWQLVESKHRNRGNNTVFV